MASFNKLQITNKGKKQLNKNKLGLTLVVLFSTLLVLLAFNVMPFLNSILFGIFGLVTYVAVIATIIVGVMLMLDKQVFLETQEIIFMIIWLIVFISIVHLSTTLNIINLSFGEYLKASFYAKSTAGGVVFSLIVYPIHTFTHTIASYILLSISLIALTTVIIEKLIANVQFKKLNTNLATKRKTAKDENKLNDVLNDNSNKSTLKENKVEQSFNEDEEIIISDEKYSEYKNSKEISEEDVSDKKKAKIILGLSEEEKEINKNILQKAKDNEREFNYNDAKKSGIDRKGYILTPKFPSDVSKDKEQNKMHGSSEISSGSAQRPPKFVHDNMQGVKPSSYESLNATPKKILSESDKKNIEFLRNSIGGDLRPRLKEEYSNKDNETTQINKEQYNYKIDDLMDEINEGIYDDSVTVKNYKNKMFNVNNNRDNFNNISQDEETVNINYSNNYKTENNNQNFNDESKTPVSANNFNNKFNSQTNSQYKKPYKKKSSYIKPSLDLLKHYEQSDAYDSEDYTQKAMMLEQTLASFKIPAKVVSITKGPAFTRFELQMPQGIAVKRVTSYTDDIAMSLEAQGAVRIEAPIPGKNAFGVEVPNETISTVGLKDVLESYSFQGSKSLLTFALGKDITGESKIAKLDKMPHLLVAGSTGSGKSVCLNSLLISLIYKASPEDLRIILIDPKRVEFTLYNGLPHLLIPNVITEPDKAISAFSWSIDEMERRFTLFSKYRVRNLDEFNSIAEVANGVEEKLPYIIIVVDELADLMAMSKKELEEKIIRIAQKSRAAGIHLVLATQRPSVDVITGIIKANLPSRISFAVSSFVDSKTILDQGGAEKLLGKGDMLYYPNDMPDPIRLQGAFVSNDEVEQVVEFIKENNDIDFDSEIEEKMFSKKAVGYDVGGVNSDEFDPLLKEALRVIIKTGGVSISKLQRMFGLGFPRAAKIVDQMELAGFVSEPDNSKMRTVLITQQEFEERFEEDL